MFLLNTVLLLVWPVATVPFLLVELWRGKRYSLYYFGIVISLFFIYYIPVGDQYRFWLIFRDFPDIDYELFASEPMHYYSLVYPLMYFVKELGCSFELVRFILLATGVFISIRCYDFICEQNWKHEYTAHERYAMAIIFLTGIPILVTAAGFRSGFAAICIAVSLVYYAYGQGKKAIFYGLLSIFFHSSSIGFLMIIVAVSIVRITSGMFIWLCLFSFIAELILAHLVFPLVSMLPEQFNYLAMYVDPDGYWKSGVKEDWGVLRTIVMKLLTVISFIIGWCVYKVTKQIEGLDSAAARMMSAVFAYLVLYLVFFDYVTIRGRVETLFKSMLAFFWLVVASSTKVRTAWTYTVCFCMLLLIGAHYMSQRETLSNCDLREFLVADIWTALSKTYQEDFVFDTVAPSGDLWDVVIRKGL